MVAGDQRLVYTPFVLSGYWSPCAPLVWNQGFPTPIMGASFRNVEQILGLVGCDLLTISPSLLEELSKMSEVPILCLTVEKGSWSPCAPLIWNEGFPTLVRGSSISNNPVKPLDIRFSSSEFRKHQPCREKALNELLTEEEFRWQMNEDEMANDKLTDGIRRFTNDALILKDLIKTRIEQQ
ncbi:unnamed protein product [Schistosoma curassoni]|uniref:Transaldolase n=1 Tax=Schistosoma curassoni TaxID=6186 RepID=A0A183JF51_9TREM|nr:unnamed protein product [Schistosoma curassoni]